MKPPPKRTGSIRRECADVADRLRALGYSWAEIGQHIQLEFKVNPRVALRLARGWAQEDVAHRWNLRWPSERPKTGKHVSYWERWGGLTGPALAVDVRPPTLDDLHRLALLYECTINDLLEEHQGRTRSAVPGGEALGDGGVRGGLAAASVALERSFFLPGSAAERQAVMAEAADAGRHAQRAEAARVPDVTLDELQDVIPRLARVYLNGSMPDLFVELSRLRAQTNAMLERTQQPAQRSDLYLVAGQLACLLAGTTIDMGYPVPAMELARAARSYGTILGHRSLWAYASGQLAMFNYLEGQHTRAVRYAQEGQAHSRSDSAIVRLAGLEAMAASAMGDRATTLAALRRAESAREASDGSDELHDRTGGMFSPTPAKQAYMAGTSLIHLNEAALAAEQSAVAIDLYTTGLPEERAEGVLAVARTDLAMARFLQKDMDGAEDALTGVYELAPDMRTIIVTTRLNKFARELALVGKGDPRVERVRGTLTEFCDTATAFALPQG